MYAWLCIQSIYSELHVVTAAIGCTTLLTVHVILVCKSNGLLRIKLQDGQTRDTRLHNTTHLRKSFEI